VKFSKGKARFRVSADGKEIVSHAGTALPMHQYVPLLQGLIEPR
jgi:hypothetical protein